MLIYIGVPIIVLCAFAVIIICIIKKKRSVVSVSLDEIIGEKCTVVERVDSFAGCGLVKVKGCQWSARGVSDDDVYDVGETLYVVAIEGVKLICKKRG